jgi:archaeal flagellar protein FlaI
MEEDSVNFHPSLFWPTVEITSENILDQYTVNSVRVTITTDGRYLISEPQLDDEGNKIYQKLMSDGYEAIAPGKDNDDPLSMESRAASLDLLRGHIWDAAKNLGITEKITRSYQTIEYILKRDILGYGILDVLMKDDNIEDISVESFENDVGIVHRKYSNKRYPILDSNVRFASLEDMEKFIQKITLASNKSINIGKPIVHIRSPEGHRLTLTLGEISLHGPTISIRKFSKSYNIVDLLKSETITPLQAAYLWILLEHKAFGIVIGGTGAGKTSTINALSGLTHPKWILLTVEDTPELQIPHKRWKPLVTKEGITTNSENAIGTGELVEVSLRMRPDFVIVGEVRGPTETKSLFDIAATGHGGLSSFHANSPEEVILRLTGRIGLEETQLALLWFSLHITKIPRENKIIRKVLTLDEYVPEQGKVGVRNIFKYNVGTDTYNIDTIEQVIEKSWRLQTLVNEQGIDLKQELEKRVKLLEECVENDITDIQQIFQKLSVVY